MLRHLPRSPDDRLLIGDHPADDAAVYRVSAELALVQTVDFFTPVVDDPYDFGRIAVANSLSDVYAMGATPLTALNVVGFPINSLPVEILSEILRGGSTMAEQAGVAIVGGHTVEDQEPKYGLAVTGTVHPDRFVSARGARPGDVLVLTKPIGTGVVTTAAKAGIASDAYIRQAVRWMTVLNRDASSAMLAVAAHAATDVTGFGLLGHLADLCDASGVSAVVNAAAVPFLPGAMEYAAGGYVPGGTKSNVAFVEPLITVSPTVSALVRLLLCDAQTSGGLLIAMPPDSVAAFTASASASMLAATIGRIVPRDTATITVTD